MRCYSVTVAILMSTYNGEQYLKEQINSIINQSYSDWHLYIRDDGSTDRTAEIIDRYTKQDSRITFCNQKHIENLGVTKSFMQLLSITDANLYMFSDQDDVWKKDKVLLSVKAMSKNTNADQPACVFTELQVVDKNLAPLKLMNNNDVWFDFPHFLFGNCVTGCTMMINQQLKAKLKLNLTKIDNIYLHDWWIALIASAVGKFIYIKEPTILYRQHNNNVEGSKSDNLFTLLQRSLNMKHELSGLIKIFTMDKEFKRLFGTRLQGYNREYLSNYISALSVGSFWKNLHLLLYFPPRRAHLKGNVLFSYLILTKRKIISNNLD